MTPQEKAKELIIKFGFSKESAIIAVDEILKLEHPYVIVYTETSENEIKDYTQEYYWEQVKKEIDAIS